MSSLAPNPLEFAFIDVSERDMDFVLAEEIECDQEFVCWLIGRTDGVSAGAKVVRVGRSVVTRQGETDLLVVYSTPGGGTRALLIENKIAAPFTRLQAERYRIRGNEGVRDGEWSDFATVLAAPQKRIADKTSRVFDYQISCEECEAAVSGTGPRAQFKRRALRAACQKARIPGIPKVDADHTAWFAAARQLSVAEFPDIPLPAETGRAFNNAWLSVILKDYPLSRVQLEIKPGNGVVDLRFYDVPIGDLRREFSTLPPGADTDQAKSGKSSSIRMRHTAANVRIPFEGQEALMRPMLQSADTLLRLAKQHRAGIMTLLGYDPE
jgi:hypothetical protein